jgi:hypothetical protein
MSSAAAANLAPNTLSKSAVAGALSSLVTASLQASQAKPLRCPRPTALGALVPSELLFAADEPSELAESKAPDESSFEQL